jgi:hypothetical protein
MAIDLSEANEFLIISYSHVNSGTYLSKKVAILIFNQLFITDS